DPALVTKLEEIKAYAGVAGVPGPSLQRMARMGAVIDTWMETNQLSITALQCWTAMEQYFGITPCTLMSMMSNKLMPSACETDVTGVLSMYALSLASEEPSALLDWNNNYGKERDKAIFFHCSNLPAAFFESKPSMGYSDIFAGDVGQENAYGTLSGRIKAAPFTYCRVSTNDLDGYIQVYLGEGQFTNDPINTFGGYGVGQIPHLQDLMKFICRENFEHHVAANISLVADPVEEALSRYLNWSVYRHA
ncbi:fucose isomerase, partial [bacterium]